MADGEGELRIGRLRVPARWWQFIKFGFVGLGNTLVSYAVEMLCLYGLLAGVMREGSLSLGSWDWPWPDVKWALCSALGFLAGVVNSYLLNSRFVFKEKQRSPWRTFLKLAASSVLASLVISYLIKLWLAGTFGFPAWLASACALLVSVPLNFLASKYWAFREHRRKI